MRNFVASADLVVYSSRKTKQILVACRRARLRLSPARRVKHQSRAGRARGLGSREYVGAQRAECRDVGSVEGAYAGSSVLRAATRPPEDGSRTKTLNVYKSEFVVHLCG